MKQIAAVEGCSEKQARELYHSRKAAGQPLLRSEAQDLVHGTKSNPIELLKAAQALLLAANGDADRAKRSLEVLTELS